MQVAPGATHVVPAQQPRLLQLPPAQQTLPGLPQGTHMALAHTLPAARQRVRSRLAAVGQQGCMSSPQPAQRPVMQAPRPMPHDMPADRHIPRRQQPPPAQLSPAQQGWPLPPQAWQTPMALHTALALHERPAQQGSPISPQPTQRLSPVAGGTGGAHTVSGAAQLSPALTPAQHGRSRVPHPAHNPPAQAPPGAMHIPPEATQRLFEQQPPPMHC